MSIAYTWLGSTPNVTVATGYNPNGNPTSADTVQDNGLGGRPTVGTSNAKTWDINSRTDYNSGGDAVTFNGKVIDTSGLGAISLSGNCIFAGGIGYPAASVYGVNNLAIANQVQSGITNGPYTGTLSPSTNRERNRPQI
jgi:hypothetical protein